MVIKKNILLRVENEDIVGGKFEFPEGVQAIGNGAFYLCNNLEEVVIPSGVKYIGEESFGCCSNLKEVSMPKSVVEVGEGAFSNCKRLERVSMPKNLKAIPFRMFENCLNLKSIALPKSLECVGDFAFENCKELKKVSIPSGVKKVGRFAFKNCASLKSVDFPSSAGVLSRGAFENCLNLESVNLQEGLKIIESGAFKNCISLEHLEIPSSVRLEKCGIFEGCDNLDLEYLGDEDEIELKSAPIIFKGETTPTKSKGGNFEKKGKQDTSLRYLTNKIEAEQMNELVANIVRLKMGEITKEPKFRKNWEAKVSFSTLHPTKRVALFTKKAFLVSELHEMWEDFGDLSKESIGKHISNNCENPVEKSKIACSLVGQLMNAFDVYQNDKKFDTETKFKYLYASFLSLVCELQGTYKEECVGKYTRLFEEIMTAM